MAFDFPATPSQGQVYQPTGGPAYQWDGEKWKGGQPSGPQKEQFFDLSGKTQQDITVPTWAKMCQIEGAVFLPAVNWTQIQVSDDGTTFKATTGDYQVAGPYHNTGTSAYTKTDSIATYGMTVDLGGDTSIPRSFSATVTVERSGAGQVFHMRSFATAYANAAGSLYRTFWQQAYVAGAATSALRLKALRILPGGGVATFAAGSWMRVRWLGDDAQVPISNAIADCPSDGGEYVRVNGVWRIKSQTFAWTINVLDIPVPTSWSPKNATIRYNVGQTGGVVMAVGLRASLDGTSFYAGATDYFYATILGQGTATSFQGITANSYAYLSFDGENTSVGHQGTIDLMIERTANQTWLYRGYSTSYNNTGGILQRIFTVAGYLGIGGGAGGRLKALRIFLSNSIAPSAGSSVTVEWLP